MRICEWCIENVCASVRTYAINTIVKGRIFSECEHVWGVGRLVCVVCVCVCVCACVCMCVCVCVCVWCVCVCMVCVCVCVYGVCESGLANW